MLEKERFENVLKSLRVKRGKEWTQEETARHLDVSRRTYVGWENGESFPSKKALKKLAALFQLDENEAEALFHSTHQAAPVRHNLPFARNPFFTGRQLLLNDLERLLEQHGSLALTQPVSISGLGGIGKTQLALEYAHRCFPHVYRSVLWVHAENEATLEASYLSIARLLQLPEQEEAKVDRIVLAVKSWLEEHTHWLLILDNADDLELARSYLPTKPRGHILFTTRSQIVGHIAALFQVEALSPEEGLLFLFRRCGVLKPGSELERLGSDIRREASTLVELLGGHPLALDQAGAYIEETTDPQALVTGASLAEYRQLYQEQRRHLLQRRGWLKREHPETVATTLEISLHKAYEQDPRCAEILAFCALLHPDTIPEELLRKGSGLNLDRLSLNEAIGALRRYSLIKRDSDKQVLSLHRLVQAVIRDGMEPGELRQWMERVIQAVNEAFPEVTFEAWSQCERYLPHALLCVNAPLHEGVPPPQIAHLLTKAGTYLLQRGQPADAEPLLARALSTCEQHLGATHPDTALSLHRLALLSYEQGKYELAESLYQRALSIREQCLGASHPDTAGSLHNLANLYRDQGKYEQAEPLYLRALAIFEQHLGASHPDTASDLHNLATLYWEQGKYEQAEPLYLRALSIREQHLGASHPETARSLHNLANLYDDQGKYELAEPLFERVLSLCEQHLGVSHPDTARGLTSLAILYWHQGKYELAEPLYLRALSIREQHLGATHPDTARDLNNLAILYRHQGKYEQAEPLYLRALSIREQHLGASHPETARNLNNLATLYRHQEKYEQAEPLYLRALVIFEQHLGAEHPDTAETLHGLAELYQQQGKYEQAEPLYQRALSIREQRLGPNHPQTEASRKAYAAFLHMRKP